MWSESWWKYRSLPPTPPLIKSSSLTWHCDRHFHIVMALKRCVLLNQMNGLCYWGVWDIGYLTYPQGLLPVSHSHVESPSREQVSVATNSGKSKSDGGWRLGTFLSRRLSLNRTPEWEACVQYKSVREAGMTHGSQGERLGVSHGLKILTAFGHCKRLYVKVPLPWTARKNLQEERKKLTTLSCPLGKCYTVFHYFSSVC